MTSVVPQLCLRNCQTSPKFLSLPHYLFIAHNHEWQGKAWLKNVFVQLTMFVCKQTVIKDFTVPPPVSVWQCDVRRGLRSVSYYKPQHSQTLQLLLLGLFCKKWTKSAFCHFSHFTLNQNVRHFTLRQSWYKAIRIPGLIFHHETAAHSGFYENNLPGSCWILHSVLLKTVWPGGRQKSA